PGSGAGAVVLKRLADALADGDPIRAVVRGSAINNDGDVKVGYTAPGIEGQAAAIAAAQADAGVEPASVSYVETHGTGTPLGDPIEVAALGRAFAGVAPGSVALGSVKTNLGHLDTAAGVAGAIKTVLALERRELPPSLHFESPNPETDLDATPFRVVGRATPWRSEGPRRAGVSSFGIGGTNAHLVLEEAPRRPPSPVSSRPRQLLVLSARSGAALSAAAARLGAALAGEPPPSRAGTRLADVAWTLQTGRRPFAWRATVVAADRAAAAAALAAPLKLTRAAEAPPPVVFLFPGQGAQRPGVGAGLYAVEPVFRREIDRGAELLEPLLGFDPRTLLFPAAADAADAAERLAATETTQPLLFLHAYALARLWQSWGVEPAAMLGHSLGEYVAACLAGVFSPDDALRLVAARGRLMAACPPGAMAAVGLDEEALAARLPDGVELAAANAPGSTVVSGPAEALERFAAALAADGVDARPLTVSHAFHSASMEACLGDYRAAVEAVSLSPPERTVISNLTGRPLTVAQATDPDYWCQQIRRPVRFADGAAHLLAADDGEAVFLEVGPGRTLTSLLRRQPAARGRVAVTTFGRPGPVGEAVDEQAADEHAAALGALGQLWQAGVEPRWEGLHEEEGGDGDDAGVARRRVPLPGYPFERKRYWIEPGGAAVVSEMDGRRGQAPPPPESEEEAPAPAYDRPELSTPWVEPQGEVERRIAAVWGELLGYERIGAADDFLELGGDSLLAARVATRLRDELATEVPVSALFETPTVALLAAALHDEAESEAEAEREAGAESDAAARAGQPALRKPPPLPPLRRRRAGTPVPLSPAQERLWVLDRIDETAAAAYNEPYLCDLDGELDLAALRAAFGALVARHEMLRTRFPEVEGAPVQVIAPPPSTAPPLPVVDLAALGTERAAAEAERVTAAEARQPFDLAAGPIWRLAVLRLAQRRHRLLLDLHHVACDARSLGILFSELETAYDAVSQGLAPLFVPLPVQYADFTLWQRRHLAGGDGEEGAFAAQLAGWKQALDGFPTLLEVPADRPRTAEREGRGGQVAFRLPAATAEAVRRLARRGSATLFMVGLAAFSTLLGRYTGRRRLLVGSPVANRRLPELEGVVGFFVNTLALPCDLSGDPSFGELLGRVRTATLAAQDRQDLPFAHLVDELQPERTATGTPLVQVFFLTQRHLGARLGEGDGGGLRLAPRRVENDSSKFDLTLVLDETDAGLSGQLDYDADLFDRATAERLAAGFEALLAAAAEAPATRLSALPVLPAEARRRLLTEWRGPARRLGEGE
ncbi:MAG TPA: condensation domain-containing protein, partial [Thermoanaerobaculia bacterium]|nr:condensation domain-containing protein [Thermoanaerobaculia bacterium]